MTEEQAKAELKKIYGMSSVIYEDKPLSNDIHPTMKPVNLFKRLILNSSVENENVLDLFGGSGTTIIACDQLKRNAFVMEYDPVYASAILERYESLTGEKAELVETKGKQTNVRKSKSKAS
jgi:DNA modification methylase